MFLEFQRLPNFLSLELRAIDKAFVGSKSGTPYLASITGLTLLID